MQVTKELGACANSVYQALFSPPPHKSLGMRLYSTQQVKKCDLNQQCVATGASKLRTATFLEDPWVCTKVLNFLEYLVGYSAAMEGNINECLIITCF